MDITRPLHDHFGFARFRPGQLEACEAALAGRDVMVVMPTGSGKSLCYQLPALLRDDVTVVVSPLVALMQDQVEALAARGLGGRVALVNAQQDAGANAEALRRAAEGELQLLYVAPERFAAPGFLERMSGARVGLFVVDEAHCVSQWGHDFRPDYFRLADAARALGATAIVASTATATPRVAADVARRLGLRDPLRVATGFDRPNISFTVARPAPHEKRTLVAEALGADDALPAIVYAGTRAGAEELAADLSGALGEEAEAYHAGLDRAERARVQRRFLADEIRVICATNAFGMGVDKADVRSVVHWAIPKSVESYYQEVGRAGRDGQPARAILLAMRADLGRLINFIKRDGAEPEQVLAYVRRLRAAGAGDVAVIDAPRDDRDRVSLGVAERAGVCALEPAPGGRLQVTFRDSPDLSMVGAVCRVARDRAWRAYRSVEAFVSGSDACRRRTLLDHFGDTREGSPSGRCCDVCDPGTIGLPDPASLTPPARRKANAPAPAGPVDAPLLDALRAWRMRASDGKPAYTVAHNSTLVSIAALKPSSLAELATVRGVGPSFVKRHGEQVLSLVAGA
jgi:ATP-dependent DNA helicase RecQ